MGFDKSKVKIFTIPDKKQNARVGKRTFPFIEDEKARQTSLHQQRCFETLFGKITTLEEAIEILKRDWFK